MAIQDNKNKQKQKLRLVVFGFLSLIICGYLFYSMFGVWKGIYQKKQEKAQLENKLIGLQEKEEELKVQVNKLKDPAYVAKYAREKYLYSGKNEYIIRIK